MSDETTKQTEAVLNHHLEAFAAGDVEAMLSDYTEDSVLHWANGSAHGLEELRDVFTNFINNIPHKEIVAAFTIKKQTVEGEVAFIAWSAEPHILFGADTFIVRDGKIALQTFGGLFG